VPAVKAEELIQSVLDALEASGCSGTLLSAPRKHPRTFAVQRPDGAGFLLDVYLWTLTPGGRPALKNEYRIQMTGVESPLDLKPSRLSVLLGFEPSLNLFGGFDLVRHREFTKGSPSVQIDVEALKAAENDGLSFWRKSNDEIAIGIRPDQLASYALNASSLHKFGKDAETLSLLKKAATLEPIDDAILDAQSAERQRVIRKVGQLARQSAFSRKVLTAYGYRCALTRVQLRLVEAAHILPVAAPGSIDEVRNGIALAASYHKAFDSRLIYLEYDASSRLHMRLNSKRVKELEAEKLVAGLKLFQQPLGLVVLPPDKAQWPSPAFIKKANAYRGVA
jgi:putative restriction endonuclease